MIVPDVNLLIYAHDVAAKLHEPAREWWEDLLNRQQPVGLPWAVTLGFVRLVTHASVLRRPLAPDEALARVEGWFAEPSVRVLDPGPRHLVILGQLFSATGVAGRLTTDTHLAAIAIEYQAALCSNDSDFNRFPGLRWEDPLS